MFYQKNRKNPVKNYFNFFQENFFLPVSSPQTDLKGRIVVNGYQKDWEPHRKKLLEAVEAEDQERFSRTFNEFTEKWLRAVPVELADTDTERQAEDIAKTYTAITAQQRFFAPQRQPIKVQRDYDPSDDGQARVYSTLFAKTRATLRGERRLFADFHAWRDGRGYLFPDLMAVLHGERKLFANLYATISRWIAEWSEWLSAKKTSHFDRSMVYTIPHSILQAHKIRFKGKHAN